MTLSDPLVHIIRFVYALLGAVSIAGFLRRRDQLRFDVALVFGLFGTVNLIQEYLLLSGTSPDRLLTIFFRLVQIAHAYLLLRLIQHVHSVPRWLLRVAISGMVVLAVLNLILPTWPAFLTAIMVFYLAGLDFYSVVALVRGAFTARGVARRRMQFGALGLGLLATALVLAGIIILVPAILSIALIAIELVAVFSGIAFYVGFAPPRFLRRAWQLAELEDFLNIQAAAPPDAPVPAILKRVAAAAVNGVGGHAALVLAPPTWQVAVATDDALGDLFQSSATQMPASVWQNIADGHAVQLTNLTASDQPNQTNRMSDNVRSALAVPIRLARRSSGVLVVLLRSGSLFPEDDLRLLELINTQASLTLEQQALIANLREQTQALEQANRELEAFAYSVSHDLRAPLRHIEGFARLMGDAHAVTDKGREYLEKILSASGQMAHLIESLLHLSRIGHAELTIVPVPLSVLVPRVWQGLQGQSPQRAIKLQLADLPVVTGDPVLLQQVFANLLSNAMKYTRSRQDPQIQIGTLPDKDSQVVIYVRDNGVGFDPAYAHKLFIVFQRLHHPNEFEGEGIGLANVRLIVQRHGGQVWADGSPGVGATFYVSLPNAGAVSRVEELKPGAQPVGALAGSTEPILN